MLDCLPVFICLCDSHESLRYRSIYSPTHNCGLGCAKPGRLAPFEDWERPLKLQKAFISPASLCEKIFGLKCCIHCWSRVAKLALQEKSRQSKRLNLRHTPPPPPKKIWGNQEIISSQPPKETRNILTLAVSPGGRQGPTAATCWTHPSPKSYQALHRLHIQPVLLQHNHCYLLREDRCPRPWSRGRSFFAFF